MIIDKIRIQGFRRVFSVDASFHSDVSYVIGRNGTGKTTFAKILVAALSVDIRALSAFSFQEISIYLANRVNSEITKISFRRSDTKDFSKGRDEITIKLVQPNGESYTCSGAFFDNKNRYSIDMISDVSDIDFYPVQRFMLTETGNLRPRTPRNTTGRGADEFAAARYIKSFFNNQVKLKWLPIERVTASSVEDEIRSSRDRGQENSAINRKVSEIQNALVRYFGELEKEKSRELEDLRNKSLLSFFSIKPSKAGSKISDSRVTAIDQKLNQLIPELKLHDALADEFREKSQQLIRNLQANRG